MQLEPREDDLYYYDENAADHAVKFLMLLRHWEDRWSGQPFIPTMYQERATRDLFGWKRRDNNLRRFRELFALIAKGNGKSAWLAALGCYMLLAAGEAAAHVISAATDFKQAQITYEWGRNAMLATPRLASKIHDTQYRIDAPNHSRWTIASGTVAGKAGDKPTCLILDEIWEAPNRRLYDTLTRNAKKRSQSLVLVASNAGLTKDSICYELYERAKRVLSGESKDDTLYPIIFEAEPQEDPSSATTWKKANPALDEIITTETLRSEWIKAKENPGLEAEFRRLHLSQWVGSSQKFFNMDQWDKCSRKFSLADVKDLPLVLALDMSLNDDLTALAYLWIGEEKLYSRVRYWLPKRTADEYESREAIPFSKWSDDGFIKLVESDTIDPKCQQQIAKTIIAAKDKFDLRCVAYDRNKASNVIALAEVEKIACVAVPQNWYLSPAVEELSRRLKSKSIQFRPSPILRWNFANAEAKTDSKGNLHIVKSGRLGQYKGRRGDKIDGCAAIITGLAQVRLEQMQPTKKKSVYENRGLFVL